MTYFKKHIALLLLAGFAFPQVANSVHYFVVPHHYNFEEEHFSKKVNNPAYDYHLCDYHLTGLTFIINPNILPDLQVKFLEPKQLFTYKIGHEIALAFTYRLRGPPNETTPVYKNQ